MPGAFLVSHLLPGMGEPAITGCSHDKRFTLGGVDVRAYLFIDHTKSNNLC